MTTSAQVRTAWNTRVWTNATVTAITDKIYSFDIADSGALTGGQAELLRYQAQVNFFAYTVTRGRTSPQLTAGGASGGLRYTFDVSVAYYLQKDQGQSDTNYNAVVDRLETIDGLVVSQLGKRWDSTVDFYEQTGAQEPQLIQLDEKEVWRGVITYRAVKTL